MIVWSSCVSLAFVGSGPRSPPSHRPFFEYDIQRPHFLMFNGHSPSCYPFPFKRFLRAARYIPPHMRGQGATAPPPLPAGASMAAPFIPRTFGAPVPQATPVVTLAPEPSSSSGPTGPSDGPSGYYGGPPPSRGGAFGDRGFGGPSRGGGGFDDRRGGFDGRRSGGTPSGAFGGGSFGARGGGPSTGGGGFFDRVGPGGGGAFLSHRGGGGGYGGGGRGYGARKNELGFHGNMHEDPLQERELFHKEGAMSSGINFDKVCVFSWAGPCVCLTFLPLQYDDIPIEVSGEAVPEPLLTFDPEIVGAAVAANLALSKYSKPTPVQKYSIPIGAFRHSSVYRGCPKLRLCVDLSMFVCLALLIYRGSVRLSIHVRIWNCASVLTFLCVCQAWRAET